LRRMLAYPTMNPEEQISAGARETVASARRGAFLTLVIPTRNEAKNVPRLVRELEESLSGVDYRVIFVDDSTDETPAVIRSLSEEDGRVVLIHREGLTSTYGWTAYTRSSGSGTTTGLAA